MLIEHDETYDVLDIFAHGGTRKKRQYLVQWKGKDAFTILGNLTLHCRLAASLYPHMKSSVSFFKIN